jgi:type I restriction enzyme S subunit
VNFARYPAYGESGVEWLGEIPGHWELRRLKHLFEFGSGGTPPKEQPDLWVGDFPWVSAKDMKTRIVESAEDTISRSPEALAHTGFVGAGAILLVARSGILRHTLPVAVAARELAFNQDLKSLTPRKRDILSLFFLYLLEGYQKQLLALWRQEGATVESLDVEVLAHTLVPLPPEAEQRAIATFLDREIAEIDALIEANRRLIEILDEKRQAVISHAVTKGLDPDAPMKPSGSDWLGEVPAHWEVKPLMFLTDPNRPIMYGIVLPGPNVEEGVLIVKGGDVKPGGLDPGKLCRTTGEIEAGCARSRLRAGDLVYSIRGTIGEVEVVPASIEGANLTQDAARIAPNAQVSTCWLLFVMRSEPIFRQLKARSLGAAVPGINIRDLKRVRVPCPPHAECAEIAEYLGKYDQTLATAICQHRRGISLLEEHRTSLITAAVTGQIDVRHEAAVEATEQALEAAQ